MKTTNNNDSILSGFHMKSYTKCFYRVKLSDPPNECLLYVFCTSYWLWSLLILSLIAHIKDEKFKSFYRENYLKYSWFFSVFYYQNIDNEFINIIMCPSKDTLWNMSLRDDFFIHWYLMLKTPKTFRLFCWHQHLLGKTTIFTWKKRHCSVRVSYKKTK